MKIFIFVLLFAAFCAFSSADIESSDDKSNAGVTTSSGNVTQSNGQSNVTDATAGDDEDKNDEEVKVEGQSPARDNTLNTNHTLSSSSNVTADDDDDANVTTSTSNANETHQESEKTDKRHVGYGTYYSTSGGNVGAIYSQQLQQPLVTPTPSPDPFYTYVDYRQSRRRYADTIPGVEGQDYPIFNTVPPTSFSCNGRPIGLYGDVEARCQVWHNCQLDGRRDAFLCPNGTLFNQQVLVCDWWYNVECETTPSYYGASAQLIQQNHHHNGYGQQVNRYQSAAGSNGYFYNYQKPFYVQTTAFPTGYYFNTGVGASSGASGSANYDVSSSTAAASINAAATSAGSSFVSSSSLNGGGTDGYYYRPTYQLASGRSSGLGGYGYTVSSHTPGYVTMRYDIPGGQYASQSAGSAAASGAGFQYSYSTGQLPTSYSVPTISGNLNTVNQAQYSQRVTSRSRGDHPDHPNYNEKSGYNYRPPQIPIPRPVKVRPQQAPVPVPAIYTATQVHTVTDSRDSKPSVQPHISIPIQPLSLLTPSYKPITYPPSSSSSGAGLQYSITGQIPTSYSVPSVDGKLNTINQVRYNQKVASGSSGDHPDHPNYNEKSGYNYRPPQIPIPLPVTVRPEPVPVPVTYRPEPVPVPVTYRPKPVPVPVTYRPEPVPVSYQPQPVPVPVPVTYTATQVHTVTDTRETPRVQPHISIPIKPIRVTTPSYEPIDHPNYNEKSGYNQPRLPPATWTSQRDRQTTNYAFSTYNANNQHAQAVNQASATAGQSTGYSYSTYNSGTYQVPATTGPRRKGLTTNYSFSTYGTNQNQQLPSIQTVVTSTERQTVSGEQSTYNRISDSVHPNANEKSGYAQPVPVRLPTSSGGRQTTSYSFSTYKAPSVDYQHVKQKPIYRPIPAVTVTPPPKRVVQVRPDPIDHPNYNEKSGYNPRIVPIGTIIPPDFPRPRIVYPPQGVQVDCTGAYTCRPDTQTVQLGQDYNDVHLNFGQRVESAQYETNSDSGSVAVSDRLADAVQSDNSRYY